MSGVRLSKEHGLNPSVGVCYVCGQDDTVILFGAAYRDKDGKTVQAPHRIVMNKTPCPKCQEMAKQGVLLVEVPDSGPEASDGSIQRTGRLWVLKPEAAETFPSVGGKRIAFISESAARKVGLPHEASATEKQVPP